MLALFPARRALRERLQTRGIPKIMPARTSHGTCIDGQKARVSFQLRPLGGRRIVHIWATRATWPEALADSWQRPQTGAKFRRSRRRRRIDANSTSSRGLRHERNSVAKRERLGGGGCWAKRMHECSGWFDSSLVTLSRRGAADDASKVPMNRNRRRLRARPRTRPLAGPPAHHVKAPALRKVAATRQNMRQARS